MVPVLTRMDLPEPASKACSDSELARNVPVFSRIAPFDSAILPEDIVKVPSLTSLRSSSVAIPRLTSMVIVAVAPGRITVDPLPVISLSCAHARLPEIRSVPAPATLPW